MLFKELELVNFRQYKGRNKLSFPTTENKNVTVIIGRNASGKSTLVEAFYWILYGKTNFKTSGLLNLELANNLKSGEYEIIKGTLKLVHEGIEYKITRKQEYTLNSKNSIIFKPAQVEINYSSPDGVADYIKIDQDGKIKNIIDKILPKDLIKQYIFDAKRITNLAENNKSVGKDFNSVANSFLKLDANSCPLIMNAPFANVDEYHIEKLSEIISEFAEQAIIFLKYENWRYAKKSLSFRLNSLYKLEKRSLTHTEINSEL